MISDFLVAIVEEELLTLLFNFDKINKDKINYYGGLLWQKNKAITRPS